MWSESALSVEDVSIRATAVESVQVMSHPKADGVLTRALLTDVAPKVRLAALRAAKLRRATLSMRQAVKAAQSDDSAHVRLDALRLIRDWLKQHPDLKTVINAFEKRDTLDMIRKEAQRLLRRP